MIILNTLILLFGCVGAAVAIAGPTYDPQKIHFLGRVTKTGWIASAFMALSLVFGITKEILQNAKERRDDAEKAQVKIESINQKAEAAKDRAEAARDKEIIRELRETANRIAKKSESLVASNQSLSFAIGQILRPINAHLDGEITQGRRLYPIFDDTDRPLWVRGGDVITCSYFLGNRPGPRLARLRIEGVGTLPLFFDDPSSKQPSLCSPSVTFLVPITVSRQMIEPSQPFQVQLEVGENEAGSGLAISVQRAGNR
jgi:hypothetical protein